MTRIFRSGMTLLVCLLAVGLLPGAALRRMALKIAGLLIPPPPPPELAGDEGVVVDALVAVREAKALAIIAASALAF